MNMFKPTATKSPEEYLGLIQEPRKSEMKFLFDYIHKIIPKEKPQIVAGMIGFGMHHFTYSSKREVDWPIVALASQKNYISVYVCAIDGKQYIAEKYKDKLGKVSVGRSCIRFKKNEDVNLKVLKEVILKGMKLVKG